MTKPRLNLPRRKKAAPPTRITNDTVAEHRERILAGGRRFKYPIQYARHRLVLTASIIASLVMVIFVLVCLQQLYMAQNTSRFFYRITNFVPVPVASVDGTSVRYSDYLLAYSGQAYYLEQSQQVDPGTKDGAAQLNHFKRESLTNAEKYAYAQKIAKEKDISVTSEDVEKTIDQNRMSYGDVSKEAYFASMQSIYGWSPDEVRRILSEGLLIQKAKLAVDAEAEKNQKAVAAQLKSNADLQAVADAVNKTATTKVQFGGSGDVPLNNADGGLSQAAARLQPNEVSKQPIVASKGAGSAGYFFLKLNSKTDTKINYSYIQVPLTAFDEQFEKLKKDHKIDEYITVKGA